MDDEKENIVEEPEIVRPRVVNFQYDENVDDSDDISPTLRGRGSMSSNRFVPTPSVIYSKEIAFTTSNGKVVTIPVPEFPNEYGYTSSYDRILSTSGTNSVSSSSGVCSRSVLRRRSNKNGISSGECDCTSKSSEELECTSGDDDNKPDSDTSSSGVSSRWTSHGRLIERRNSSKQFEFTQTGSKMSSYHTAASASDSSCHGSKNKSLSDTITSVCSRSKASFHDLDKTSSGLSMTQKEEFLSVQMGKSGTKSKRILWARSLSMESQSSSGESSCDALSRETSASSLPSSSQSLIVPLSGKEYSYFVATSVPFSKKSFIPVLNHKSSSACRTQERPSRPAPVVSTSWLTPKRSQRSSTLTLPKRRTHNKYTVSSSTLSSKKGQRSFIPIPVANRKPAFTFTSKENLIPNMNNPFALPNPWDSYTGFSLNWRNPRSSVIIRRRKSISDQHNCGSISGDTAYKTSESFASRSLHSTTSQKTLVSVSRKDSANSPLCSCSRRSQTRCQQHYVKSKRRKSPASARNLLRNNSFSLQKYPELSGIQTLSKKSNIPILQKNSRFTGNKLEEFKLKEQLPSPHSLSLSSSYRKPANSMRHNRSSISVLKEESGQSSTSSEFTRRKYLIIPQMPFDSSDSSSSKNNPTTPSLISDSTVYSKKRVTSSETKSLYSKGSHNSVEQSEMIASSSSHSTCKTDIERCKESLIAILNNALNTSTKLHNHITSSSFTSSLTKLLELGRNASGANTDSNASASPITDRQKFQKEIAMELEAAIRHTLVKDKAETQAVNKRPITKSPASLFRKYFNSGVSNFIPRALSNAALLDDAAFSEHQISTTKTTESITNSKSEIAFDKQQTDSFPKAELKQCQKSINLSVINNQKVSENLEVTKKHSSQTTNRKITDTSDTSSSFFNQPSNSGTTPTTSSAFSHLPSQELKGRERSVPKTKTSNENSKETDSGNASESSLVRQCQNSIDVRIQRKKQQYKKLQNSFDRTTVKYKTESQATNRKLIAKSVFTPSEIRKPLGSGADGIDFSTDRSLDITTRNVEATFQQQEASTDISRETQSLDNKLNSIKSANTELKQCQNYTDLSIGTVKKPKENELENTDEKTTEKEKQQFQEPFASFFKKDNSRVNDLDPEISFLKSENNQQQTATSRVKQPFSDRPPTGVLSNTKLKQCQKSIDLSINTEKEAYPRLEKEHELQTGNGKITTKYRVIPPDNQPSYFRKLFNPAAFSPLTPHSESPSNQPQNVITTTNELLAGLIKDIYSKKGNRETHPLYDTKLKQCQNATNLTIVKEQGTQDKLELQTTNTGSTPLAHQQLLESLPRNSINSARPGISEGTATPEVSSQQRGILELSTNALKETQLTSNKSVFVKPEVYIAPKVDLSLCQKSDDTICHQSISYKQEPPRVNDKSLATAEPQPTFLSKTFNTGTDNMDCITATFSHASLVKPENADFPGDEQVTVAQDALHTQTTDIKNDLNSNAVKETCRERSTLNAMTSIFNKLAASKLFRRHVESSTLPGTETKLSAGITEEADIVRATQLQANKPQNPSPPSKTEETSSFDSKQQQGNVHAVQEGFQGLNNAKTPCGTSCITDTLLNGNTSISPSYQEKEKCNLGLEDCEKVVRELTNNVLEKISDTNPLLFVPKLQNKLLNCIETLTPEAQAQTNVKKSLPQEKSNFETTSPLTMEEAGFISPKTSTPSCVYTSEDFLDINLLALQEDASQANILIAHTLSSAVKTTDSDELATTLQSISQYRPSEADPFTETECKEDSEDEEVPGEHNISNSDWETEPNASKSFVSSNTSCFSQTKMSSSSPVETSKDEGEKPKLRSVRFYQENVNEKRGLLKENFKQDAIKSNEPETNKEEDKPRLRKATCSVIVSNIRKRRRKLLRSKCLRNHLLQSQGSADKTRLSTFQNLENNTELRRRKLLEKESWIQEQLEKHNKRVHPSEFSENNASTKMFSSTDTNRLTAVKEDNGKPSPKLVSQRKQTQGDIEVNSKMFSKFFIPLSRKAASFFILTQKTSPLYPSSLTPTVRKETELVSNERRMNTKVSKFQNSASFSRHSSKHIPSVSQENERDSLKKKIGKTRIQRSSDSVKRKSLKEEKGKQKASSSMAIRKTTSPTKRTSSKFRRKKTMNKQKSIISSLLGATRLISSPSCETIALSCLKLPSSLTKAPTVSACRKLITSPRKKRVSPKANRTHHLSHVCLPSSHIRSGRKNVQPSLSHVTESPTSLVSNSKSFFTEKELMSLDITQKESFSASEKDTFPTSDDNPSLTLDDLDEKSCLSFVDNGSVSFTSSNVDKKQKTASSGNGFSNTLSDVPSGTTTQMSSFCTSTTLNCSSKQSYPTSSVSQESSVSTSASYELKSEILTSSAESFKAVVKKDKRSNTQSVQSESQQLLNSRSRECKMLPVFHINRRNFKPRENMIIATRTVENTTSYYSGIPVSCVSTSTSYQRISLSDYSKLSSTSETQIISMASFIESFKVISSNSVNDLVSRAKEMKTGARVLTVFQDLYSTSNPITNRKLLASQQNLPNGSYRETSSSQTSLQIPGYTFKRSQATRPSNDVASKGIASFASRRTFSTTRRSRLVINNHAFNFKPRNFFTSCRKKRLKRKGLDSLKSQVNSPLSDVISSESIVLQECPEIDDKGIVKSPSLETNFDCTEEFVLPESENEQKVKERKYKKYKKVSFVGESKTDFSEKSKRMRKRSSQKTTYKKKKFKPLREEEEILVISEPRINQLRCNIDHLDTDEEMPSPSYNSDKKKKKVRWLTEGNEESELSDKLNTSTEERKNIKPRKPKSKKRHHRFKGKDSIYFKHPTEKYRLRETVNIKTPERGSDKNVTYKTYKLFDKLKSKIGKIYNR